MLHLFGRGAAEIKHAVPPDPPKALRRILSLRNPMTGARSEVELRQGLMARPAFAPAVFRARPTTLGLIHPSQRERITDCAR